MSEILDFPMPRAAGCPFAPPPEVLERSATKQLFRVRIWDGSTPWLVTGYEAIRSLFGDGRASVDDRKPGYPHWNEGMLATVHKRPRSVFTSDAEEHTRFRRMLSRPFTYKRVEALRPAVQRIADRHVDAILDADHIITRIDDYDEWVTRFETAMRALPERQRSESVLAALDIYRQPAPAVAGSVVPGKHFQAAVDRLGLQIPHVGAELITKYLSDMKQAGLL